MTDIKDRLHQMMLRSGFQSRDDQQTLLAGVQEIDRMRAAGLTALEYLHGMQHMGSLVDQAALAADIAKLEAAIGYGQSREQAMQELADQAQALDMGYGQSTNKDG